MKDGKFLAWLINDKGEMYHILSGVYMYYKISILKWALTKPGSDRTGSDRTGLTKPGPDWTGLTEPGRDVIRLTKPGSDPKKP